MKKIILITILILFSISILSSQDCVPEDSVYKFTFNNRNYEFITVAKTWDDAQECAKARGGYLADIESEEENLAFTNYLLDSLRLNHSIDLKKDNDTIIWLGGESKLIYEGTENLYTWYWKNPLTMQQEKSLANHFYSFNQFDPQKNKVTFPNNIYLNWGQELSSHKYPWFGDKQLETKIALALDNIYLNGTKENTALIGQWVNLNPEEELYFLIDYGCTNEIINKIDTVICSEMFRLGDSIITETGFYKQTLNSYTDCDSVVELTIDFASINNEMTIQSDRLLSKELQADFYQWYRCDLNLPIQDANTFFLTIEETGSYRLELEKNGCDFVTECYDFCIPSTFKIDTVKCANESITINGQEYEKKGFYSQKLKQEGFDCDSTLEIDIRDVAINLSVKQQSGKLVSSENAGEYQWYNCEGDVLIADATEKEYTPKENGDYKVEITKQGCIDYSVCYNYSTSSSSVKDIQDSDNVRLDEVNRLIVFNNKNYDQIELMDMNSKTIYKTDQFSQSISIDYLTTGVYFLKVVNGNEVKIFKFMVVE